MSAYASGVLTGPAEVAVRRHLASGCRECLAALFRHRLGLPRPAPAEPQAAAGRPWLVLGVVLVVMALMGTVLASTLWRRGREEPVAARPRGGPAIAALETRAAEAERRLGSLADRSRSLTAHLGSLTRVPAPAPPRHVYSDARAGRALAGLGSALALPATRLVPLRPTASGGSARGWLAWDPLRGWLFVYAVGLPPLVAPWEVRVGVAGETRRLPLARLADGGLWARIERFGDGACVASVAVVPPGADRKVLRGDVVICPVQPAA